MSMQLVDVGGLGHIPSFITSRLDIVSTHIVVNPLPPLNQTSKNVPTTVIPAAAFDANEYRTLYIPKDKSGASLFPPNLSYVQQEFPRLLTKGNPELARTWEVRSKVVRTLSIDCKRLDDIAGRAFPTRKRTFAIFDAQGGEFSAIRGGENFLREACAGVLVKVFTVPLYTDAPLCGDVVELLRSYGYALEASSEAAHTFQSQRYCLFLNSRASAEDAANVRSMFGVAAPNNLSFNWPSAAQYPIKDPLVILGNGPSLADVDFSALTGFHSCGFNAAYRAFERRNYWPTYLASLDYNLTPSHSKAFCELITGQTANGIKGFFFINSVEWLRRLGNNVHVIPGWKEVRYEFPKPGSIPPGHSGYRWCGNSAATMVEVFANMGYRQFVLLGVDASYTEKLPFAREVEPGRLEINETPERNPNYWFGDYQQRGDAYTVPNAQSAHVNAWNSLAQYARERGDIKIVNGSPASALECFPKTSWRAALEAATGEEDEDVRNASRRLQTGFEREDHASIDEGKLVCDLLSSVENGIMVDVGAHHGSSAALFLRRNWQVLAFEPDTKNRNVLKASLGGYARLTIDDRAVSDSIATGVPYFTSPESTGISGLHAFAASHSVTDHVRTTTLAAALATYSIETVDYLKVDTEGNDLFVLRGFPWHKCRPRAVLCEFENNKTLPLGYCTEDLGDFLVSKGYLLFISEWHPIEQYGARHVFKRFVPYDSRHLVSDSWGNLLALRDTDLASVVNAAAQRHIRFR